MNRNLQLISNSNFDEGMIPQTAPSSDERLLDAYSQAVIGVVDISPAQSTGLVEGDVIVGMNNQPIASIDDLHKLLTHEQVAMRSLLTIIRRNDKLIIDIVSASKPAIND